MAGHDPPEEILGQKSTRLTFFFHFLDFSLPILTPFDPVDLPTPTPRPVRLERIEYEPVD